MEEGGRRVALALFQRGKHLKQNSGGLGSRARCAKRAGISYRRWIFITAKSTTWPRALSAHVDLIRAAGEKGRGRRSYVNILAPPSRVSAPNARCVQRGCAVKNIHFFRQTEINYEFERLRFCFLSIQAEKS